MKKIVILLVFATLHLSAQELPKQPSVSVSGEGTVKVVPDEVVLNIRVEYTGDNAAEVKTRNDATVNNVLQFCKKMRIAGKDVRTEYINLNKNYDYQKKEYHYTANQAIRILLRDLGQYEELVQGLVGSGINRIDGITFQSSQIEKYQSEARIKAIKNAKQKAEEYANALQQSIGKATTISENIAYNPMPVMNRGMLNQVAMDAGNANETTIAVGQMSVSATVQVTFELK